MKIAIPLPYKQLTEFCDRWHVTELAFFSSSNSRFKRAIERSSNWIRRQEILSTARVIYAKQ
jgi:hypothetical protein